MLSLWKLNKFMTTAVFVSPLVNIHTHRLNSDNSIQVLSCELSQANNLQTTTYTKSTRFSVGMHPLFLAENTTFDAQLFQEFIRQYPVVAIGEIGLDKHSPVSLEMQIDLFRQQVHFAHQHHFPVIIHCTGRWSELELLFRERKETDPIWMIHGFRKTGLAEKFLKLGAHFGIGAALLYDERLQTCVKALPLDCLFLETDDADVELLALYEKLAVIKSLPLQTIVEQLYTNYTLAFHYE